MLPFRVQDAKRSWRLRRDHIHARRKNRVDEEAARKSSQASRRREHPPQPSRAITDEIVPAHRVSQFSAVHHGVFRPIHQLRWRDLVMKIRGDLSRRRFVS